MSVDRVAAADRLRDEELQAIDALFGMIAGPAGFVQLEYHELGEPPLSSVGTWRQHWVRCDDLARWSHHAAFFSERFDTRFAVAPRARRDAEAVAPCSILWAVTESREAAARLGRFNPPPTLILRQGETARLTAIWALERPLGWEWTERACRRLAHALRAPKKWARPDVSLFMPGSAVRMSSRGPRLLPQRVNVEAFRPGALYTARRVVGHLPEPPDPNGWRDRKDAR